MRVWDVTEGTCTSVYRRRLPSTAALLALYTAASLIWIACAQNWLLSSAQWLSKETSVSDTPKRRYYRAHPEVLNTDLVELGKGQEKVAGFVRGVPFLLVLLGLLGWDLHLPHCVF